MQPQARSTINECHKHHQNMIVRLGRKKPSTTRDCLRRVFTENFSCPVIAMDGFNALLEAIAMSSSQLAQLLESESDSSRKFAGHLRKLS